MLEGAKRCGKRYQLRTGGGGGGARGLPCRARGHCFVTVLLTEN